MRLLFADATSPATVDQLESRGHTCVVEPDLGAGDLAARIRGYDALVVRSTRVAADVFDAADRLALVVRAGAGTNTIDTSAAAAKGVFVANVPGRNSIAVAELTLGLLLAIDRRIPDNVADLRAGRWDKKTYSGASGLYGSTLAIVGVGDVGLAVAERAAGFGIIVQVLSKDDRAETTQRRLDELGAVFVDSLEKLVSSSDAVSLHVPSHADTRGMVDARFLGWMQPGAILINTSRGDVVDETALIAAIEEKGLRVGLDVYADEPSASRTAWSSKLAQHPNVVGTHHIGASTEQAQRAIADGVVEVVVAFAEGQTANCVNLAPLRIGAVTLSVRHLDRVGVLARVLDLLSAERLNVEHMQNRVFEGGEAAVATIDVGGEVDDALVETLRAVPDVLSVSVATLPTVASS
jgi:D-3-phosphoglycerate dehydrogenase / 2-oxoglutarate reductase